MSSLNSMTRFESTLNCSTTVDVQSHTTDGFDSVYLASTTPNGASPDSLKKVAAPAPSKFTPWLLSLVYPLGRTLVVPFYFGQITIKGREYLPANGPIIVAPTHRSRWDAVIVPLAVGYHVTRRHLRFMVSADEVTGLQGWFIRRLGGFPINTKRPAIASLRHGVDLLAQGEALVIFPEGNIFREEHVQSLKPGLARLAIQAESSRPNLGVKVVPIHIHYSNPLVPWRTEVEIAIGPPLPVADFCKDAPKQDAKQLTKSLETALKALATQFPEEQR